MADPKQKAHHGTVACHDQVVPIHARHRLRSATNRPRLWHSSCARAREYQGGWGVVLSNLGSKISYTNDASEKDFIPANLGLGVAYVKAFDDQNKVTFGLDVNKLLVPTPPLVGDTAG